MATAVPYNPVPGQTLQDIPTPEMRPNIPKDAFGGQVGQAMEGLGRTVSGVGDEAFSAAMKLQDLANRAEVDKADAEFMKQAGLLHADFTALKGLNAKEAFPKYQQDLETARTNIRNGIKSPAAQKMYDSTSLGTYGRTIFNGAGHAGTEVSVAARESLKERIQTLVSVGGNSADPGQVEDSRKKAVGLTHQLYKDLGRPEAAADAETIINSSVAANHIQYLAKNQQLDLAMKKFTELKDGDMTKEDYDRTRQAITSQVHAQGSAQIVDDLITKHVDADGNLDTTVEKLQDEAKQRAKDMAPKDAVFPDVVVRTLDTRIRTQTFAKHQERSSNLQQLDRYMQNGIDTLPKLLDDPKGKQLYDRLSAEDQNKVPGRMSTYVRMRDNLDNQASLTLLNGMRKNDVQRFLDVNPADPQYKLSQPQQRQVQDWKEELRKDPKQDPSVNRAMSWLRGPYGSALQSLGMYHRNNKDPDDYDHFTGLLSEALTAWQEKTGKPATQEEVNNKIAPQLFQTHTTREKDSYMEKVFGPGKSDPYFKDVLDTKHFKDYYEQFKKQRADEGRPEPDTNEAARIYYRGIAKQLWGKPEQ